MHQKDLKVQLEPQTKNMADQKTTIKLKELKSKTTEASSVVRGSTGRLEIFKVSHSVTSGWMLVWGLR